MNQVINREYLHGFWLIYVRYYTCEVLPDHSLVVYDDIYARDGAIKRVLYP